MLFLEYRNYLLSKLACPVCKKQFSNPTDENGLKNCPNCGAKLK